MTTLSRYVDEKVRLCAILAYDIGHDPSDIAEILQISETTAYQYINDYLTRNKTTHDPKGGTQCKLTPAQEVGLIAHLHSITYMYAKDVCAYISKTYGVKYSVAGITKWLERNEFVYKKPKVIPSKLNSDAQAEFIEYYAELKRNKSKDEVILFMDAVHPEYQSQTMYGLIPKGETKALATTNTQSRLHLNGVINLDTMDVFTRKYDTIDSIAIVSFLQDLEAHYPNKIIHIICDNGRSNKNKLIQEYLSNSMIKIHYLPAYSPNLNAIERLWKIMRELILYNKYYQSFREFTNKIFEFFNCTVFKITDVLKGRINDDFQIIYHNPVRLSS